MTKSKPTKDIKVGELLSKYVSFRIGRKSYKGFVTSIDHGIACIRGIEQNQFERPAYYLHWGDLKILTHKEVYKLATHVESLLN